MTEGHTWKQNIQLRVREEQLADEAMRIARYTLRHSDASAMNQPWSTFLAPNEKDSFGWSLTARKNSSMSPSARNISSMSKWTNAGATSNEIPKNGGKTFTMRTGRSASKRQPSSESWAFGTQ